MSTEICEGILIHVKSNLQQIKYLMSDKYQLKNDNTIKTILSNLSKELNSLKYFATLYKNNEIETFENDIFELSICLFNTMAHITVLQRIINCNKYPENVIGEVECIAISCYEIQNMFKRLSDCL